MLKVIALTVIATIGVLIIADRIVGHFLKNKEEEPVRPEIKAEIEKLADTDFTYEQLLNLSDYLLNKCYLSYEITQIAKLPCDVSSLRFEEKMLLCDVVQFKLKKCVKEMDAQDETIRNYYS